MLEFITRLKERYQSVARAQQHGEGHPPFDDTLASLTLAEAALQMLEIGRDWPDRKPQIVVIGPTQAGKSTVVNLLLDRPQAGVSALAGFTVHPQGFVTGGGDGGNDWLPRFFAGYQQRSIDDLTGAPYRAYALTRAGDGPLSPAVIWDTPDFDSVDAGGYRDAVLRTIALADLLLLVVSKDKYADQRVWQTLELLLPLHIPLAICINKLGGESRKVVVESLRGQLRAAGFAEERVPVCTLPYRRDLDRSGRGLDPAQVDLLRQTLRRQLSAVDRDSRRRHLHHFIRQHWPEWIAPVQAERAADAAWDEMVEQAMENALADYRRDYLDHPQNYETFQQAIAELLTLLEIPILADSLGRARQLITWPLRQLIGAGRSLFGKQSENGPPDSNQEQRMLNQICHHTLIHLAEEALHNGETDPGQESWWRGIATLLRERRPELEQQFARSVDSYQKRFRPEIERSARSLYEQLQQQPATLNSLRAARVTADAAAVVVAVKSGGLNMHDLIVAPAMLSLTSMLTESTLGHYMDRVAAELKQRQLEAVRKELLAPLRGRIRQLREQLDPARRFGIGAEELSAAEQELQEFGDGR